MNIKAPKDNFKITSTKADQGKNILSQFMAKSGLSINFGDDSWLLLPNKGKGNKIHVGWVRSPLISEEDRRCIFDVFIYYVRTKAASTTFGVVNNVKPYLENGIPALSEISAKWSGLKIANKKCLNQFFGTLSRFGESRFDEYHRFTSTHLEKRPLKNLDPNSGALSECEFSSLAKEVNNRFCGIKWSDDKGIDFYKSEHLFGRLRSKITNKLLVSIVRRPLQVSLLKWADLIPVGSSFLDDNIHPEDEVGSLGGQSLQLRVFTVKSKGKSGARDFPERFPIYLSESISNTLSEYKGFFIKGLSFLFESSGIKLNAEDALRLAAYMPMFPHASLFDAEVKSLQSFKLFFTSKSTVYHISECSVTNAIRLVPIISDRSEDSFATSNRIRHTVLTRGAQDGLPAVHLAKITGVTVPAARHYVDMSYESRLLIDSKYVGNDFLKKIFSVSSDPITSDEDSILDRNFNVVGGAKNSSSCQKCSVILGRPLGCYGCPNFRAIAEADHRSVLVDAEDKLSVNRASLLNPIYTRSLEKLEVQIEWVRLTISVCDEYLERSRTINAE